MGISLSHLSFLLCSAGFLFLLGLFVWPVKLDSLRSGPDRSSSYEQSMEHINALMPAQDERLADYGRPIVLTHGRKMEKAIVLYHGYTNCPRQYEKLSGMFFERGYNVYVPLVPYHGLKDRTTEEVGRLTLGDIRRVCDQSVDIAQGLGDKVTVLGLSMGGVMAAWDAQFRDDVDTAVILVPSFGWYFLPGIVRPLINAAYLAPKMFFWWDPVKRDNRNAPYSMYHKFCSRGMGHVMKLGLAVIEASTRTAPGCKDIIVMTNAMDYAVDEWTTRTVMKHWRQEGVPPRFYQFPGSMKMEHDVIDPLHPYEKTDQVYKTIFEYLDEAA